MGAVGLHFCTGSVVPNNDLLLRGTIRQIAGKLKRCGETATFLSTNFGLFELQITHICH